MKIKEKDIYDIALPSKHQMKKRINTLELEIETLKETIKDELYKTFMQKLAEPQENKRLTEENKKLRKKIKTLKELIMEEQYGTRRGSSNSRKESK